MHQIRRAKPQYFFLISIISWDCRNGCNFPFQAFTSDGRVGWVQSSHTQQCLYSGCTILFFISFQANVKCVTCIVDDRTIGPKDEHMHLDCQDESSVALIASCHYSSLSLQKCQIITAD